MPTVDSVLEIALTLSPEDRATLTRRLHESLPADDTPGPDGWPANLHPAWKAEIARRSAESEDDDVSWEQVQQDMQDVIDQADRERATRGEG